MKRLKKFVPTKLQIFVIFIFVGGFSLLTYVKDPHRAEIESYFKTSDYFHDLIGDVKSVSFGKRSFGASEKRYKLVLTGTKDSLRVYLVINTLGSKICYMNADQKICKEDLLQIKKKGESVWD